MNRRISVIIPCFNHGHYLERAVSSIHRGHRYQTEVIVVNDGSTDNTALIAGTLGADVRYVFQTNQGLAAARNTGIRHATGEWLFFLDADDLMMPHTLEVMGRALEDADSAVALIACRAQVISEPVDPDSLPKPDLMDDPSHSIQEVSWKALAFGTRFPPTVLVRRSVFDEVGLFDEGFGKLGCEDRDMWLRIAARFRILLLPRQLVYMVKHSSNMSSLPIPQLAGRLRCLQKARQTGMVPWWNLWFWARVVSAHHFTACLLWSNANQPARAVWHGLLSVIVFPWPGLAEAERKWKPARYKRLCREIFLLVFRRS